MDDCNTPSVNAVSEFFDSLADGWDESAVVEPDKIEKIISYAGLKHGMNVCDIACGTGVMVPFYLKHGAKSVVGIDISAEMIRIAEEKFAGIDNVSFVNADICEYAAKDIDIAFIYSAYPHFFDKDALVKNTAAILVPGGRFVVAHSKSREGINAHHHGSASRVSTTLMPANDEAVRWGKYFKVDNVIDSDEMYVISGAKL